MVRKNSQRKRPSSYCVESRSIRQGTVSCNKKTGFCTPSEGRFSRVLEVEDVEE